MSFLWNKPIRWKLSVVMREIKEKGFFSKNHHHAFHEIGFVILGECEWFLRKNKRILLKQGDLICVPAYVEHREEMLSGKKGRLAWIGFEFKPDEKKQDQDNSIPKVFESAISSGNYFSDVLGVFEKICQERQSGRVGSDERIQWLIWDLLLLMYRESGLDPVKRTVENQLNSLNLRQIEVVQNAAYYFEENFSQTLSIEQVAKYYSLCAPYFSTIFRKYHGISPQVYLQKIRMKRAQEYVLEGKLTLKEIADRCGYTDLSHLCKWFKKSNGVSPKEYRRRRSGH